MPIYAYILIIVGIVLWFYPFISAHQKTPGAIIVNKASRWGVLLQLVSFTLLWQGHFWTRSLPPWRLAVSVVLFGFAIALSWSSSRALAGQLRVDAALGADHHLVRSGAYALVRNPIYTSMLLVICATGVIVTAWRLFVPAVILFVMGTEIRVRSEEKLLASRFGEDFQAYRRKVPAYIPFVPFL
jgi:protein-S-isoprenylcysteine O-methyltransferase Ste14